MRIDDDKMKKLLKLIALVVTDGIKAVYEYQKTNSYMPKYYHYPELFFKGIEESDTYKELREKVDTFKYDIPFFHSTNYNTPIDYAELFSLDSGQFKIGCRTLKGFDDLISFFGENQDARVMLADEDKNIEYLVVSLVKNIINRYLYETELFQDSDVNSDVVEELTKKQLIRLYAEQLAVDICIPICFLEFEKDEIEITDTITINRMTKEFQLSRYNANSFDSTQENELVQCAGFMIRLKGYSVENKKQDSLHNAVSNYWAYPTNLIDDLFAAIRIVVGCTTGYGQLLIEPIGWADKWTANMVPLYGATIRAFNRRETNIKLFGYRIEKVSQGQMGEIREIYKILREKHKEEKKNKLFKKVFIAVQRLNRCMLREAEDDTALDAIIGIETLLSGDTHGEITYTISNRISVVAANLKECAYSPAEARKAMKIIYNYRSDIVHGRALDKNSKITIKDKVIKTKELAIEFLRYTLLFLMRNQEYLDVQKFEMALDDASESKGSSSKTKTD